jgi:hypothetical protein
MSSLALHKFFKIRQAPELLSGRPVLKSSRRYSADPRGVAEVFCYVKNGSFFLSCPARIGF